MFEPSLRGVFDVLRRIYTASGPVSVLVSGEVMTVKEFGKRYGATLVLFPLLALFSRTYWTWTEATGIEGIAIVHADGRPNPDPAHPAGFYRVREGSNVRLGYVLQNHDALLITLARPISDLTLGIQASANELQITVSGDGEKWTPLTQISAEEGFQRLVTRSVKDLHTATPFRYIRIDYLNGDFGSVSWLQVESPLWRCPAIVLGAILWAAALMLSAARRLRFARVADALLALWSRIDLPLGAVLVYLLFFRIPAEVAVAALLLSIAILLAFAIRRATLGVAFVLVLTYLSIFQLFPLVFKRLLMAKLGRMYELSVDHPLVPYAEVDTNADGIRFKGEASSLSRSDFVIAFLGDSFTYGYGSDYEHAYPYQAERVLRERCNPRVRAVNMGWTSSSPLLGLRRLKQIGPKYHPQLVVYTLDMTDFTDDAEYEERLRRNEKFDPDVWGAWEGLLRQHFAWLPLDAGVMERVGALLRYHPEEEHVKFRGMRHGERFSVTKWPLSETQADIERFVMRNLLDLHKYSTEILQSPMALVVEPRAYQYTARESPRNYEAYAYQPLGPYVREPFRYFDEVKEKLPYKVYSLLPAFEGAKEFPLYHEDDPHWNNAGNHLAGINVAEFLIRERLVPCVSQASGAPTAGSS